MAESWDCLCCFLIDGETLNNKMKRKKSLGDRRRKEKKFCEENVSCQFKKYEILCNKRWQ